MAIRFPSLTRAAAALVVAAPGPVVAALLAPVPAAAAAASAAVDAAVMPTNVTVRVISQDAKFVGDLTGGAAVRLVDVASGAVLAEGVVTGSTGDTPAIMAAQGRSPPRATPGAAAFRARLAIARPTLVRVEVTGPLGIPATMQRASSERWLIPGAHVGGDDGADLSAGDGWVVELPGLAIMLDGAPPVWRTGVAQPLTAYVQLMCGCPITPGGMWAAEDYAVSAMIDRPDGTSTALPLTFSAAPGRFAATWTPATPGPATITITAINRRTGNAGVLRTAAAVE